MDYSPPGSSVHGILQARILEWVAIFFSRGSFWPKDWTHVSCISRQIFFFLSLSHLGSHIYNRLLYKHLIGRANPKLTIENVKPIFNRYMALGAKESSHSSDLKLLGRQANIKQINKFQKKTRSWFFEKININKPLARLIRKKGRGLKSINLEMKKKLQLTP